jgi:hypothetical protein
MLKSGQFILICVSLIICPRLLSNKTSTLWEPGAKFRNSDRIVVDLQTGRQGKDFWTYEIDVTVIGSSKFPFIWEHELSLRIRRSIGIFQVKHWWLRSQRRSKEGPIGITIRRHPEHFRTLKGLELPALGKKGKGGKGSKFCTLFTLFPFFPRAGRITCSRK